MDLRDLVLDILGRPADTAHVDSVPPSEFRKALLPIIGSEPTSGLKLGISTKLSKRRGDPRTTALSQLSASFFMTTKQQFGATLYGGLYSSGNQSSVNLDTRYLNTSQPTYGLGDAKPASDAGNMSFQLGRLNLSYYWRVPFGILAGAGYSFDSYFQIFDELGQTTGQSPYLEYEGGSRDRSIASGWTLGMVRETRDNPINPKYGSYVAANLAFYPTWMGSDESWQAATVDVRGYLHPGKLRMSTLALRGYSWLTFGHAPYLELPATGWDRDGTLGRGYGQGRIRGSKFLYGEAEWRQTVTRNGLFGVVGFFNLLAATQPGQGHFDSPDPGYGLGIRVKLDKRTGANIRVDYGFGAQGSNGLYMGLNEVF
jgi:hypothetical protein